MYGTFIFLKTFWIYIFTVFTVLMIILPLILARVGGVVVNTCGWVTGAGYKMLVHAAKAFDSKE